MTPEHVIELAKIAIATWPCDCPREALAPRDDCPAHTLGPRLTSGLTQALEDQRALDRAIDQTVVLNAKCRHCQRPMAAHCDGCGACWPNDACALDCDVNAPHPSWTEPEL
jgi:hypothetical protein